MAIEKIYTATSAAITYAIRLATSKDLPALLELYHQARLYMIAQGNPTQWQAYPSKEILSADISAKQLYVLETTPDSRLLGSFVMQLGAEPDYENSKSNWASNTLSYVTLHRVASAHILPHTFAEIVRFALAQTKDLYNYSYIRIDTHKDNLPMQAAIKQANFKYCGKIMLSKGGERLAYDYLATDIERGKL